MPFETNTIQSCFIEEIEYVLLRRRLKHTFAGWFVFDLLLSISYKAKISNHRNVGHGTSEKFKTYIKCNIIGCLEIRYLLLMMSYLV